MPTRLHRYRRLFLYAYLTLALLLMFLGLRAQNHHFEQQRKEDTYSDCLRRVDNVHRLNRLYSGLIDIERNNPFRFTSPSTVERRIELFRQAQLTPPVCEKP